MDAKYSIIFHLRVILLVLVSWPLFAQQDTVVLVAKKNTPSLNKLLNNLKSIEPSLSYQISTSGKPLNVSSDAYVISVGTNKNSHFDFSKNSKRIGVMLTAKQADDERMASSILVEPPLARQLKLANLLIPGSKPLGLLVSSIDDRDRRLATLTKSQINMLKIVNVADFDNINQALYHVLKDTRLLLGSYDDEIYNAKNIKNILITSYRQQKVLVGPSRAYLKAGSFATTFSDLSHIAQRILDIIQHHKKTGLWLKTGYNPYYRILFNSQVARSLNIRVSNVEILKQQMGED
jgi:hypothetical protein